MTIRSAPPTNCLENSGEGHPRGYSCRGDVRKISLGWYLDGRVTAVVGTHTHIPTADEHVLPNGTAYITDVGMSGPYDGVIGVKKELVVGKFLNGMPVRFEPATGDVRLCAVVIDCDEDTGKARSIERLMLM